MKDFGCPYPPSFHVLFKHSIRLPFRMPRTRVARSTDRTPAWFLWLGPVSVLFATVGLGPQENRSRQRGTFLLLFLSLRNPEVLAENPWPSLPQTLPPPTTCWWTTSIIVNASRCPFAFGLLVGSVCLEVLRLFEWVSRRRSAVNWATACAEPGI